MANGTDRYSRGFLGDLYDFSTRYLPLPTAGEIAAGAESAWETIKETATDVKETFTGEKAVEAAEDVVEAKMPYLEEALGGVRTSGQEQVGMFDPYTRAGERALHQQSALAGLLGPEAQATAIAQLEGSPQFQAMMQQGERAILQNAAATGGLRGGNTQAMLATFRPQVLSQLIEQQYGRLGGLSGQGLSAVETRGQQGRGYAGLEAEILGQQGNLAAFPATAEMGRQQGLTGMAQGALAGGLDIGGKLIAGALFPPAAVL